MSATISVNEVFETIQGEATFTGMPSLFVRLQGCAVGCPWCDTKHTWHANPGQQVHLDQLFAKQGDDPTFAVMGPHQLVSIASRRFASRHVVITGGEPCEQEHLHELIDCFLNVGRSVQLETSGTAPIVVPPATWVTLSPKLSMPGGKDLLFDALQLADEIKMPVGKVADVERLGDLLMARRSQKRIAVWLQPLSQSPKATQLCIDAARENGWRVSFQVHKYLNLR